MTWRKREIEAMKLALEALEAYEMDSIYDIENPVITSLKEALAQPEQEPVACTACEGDPKAGNIPCCICGATLPQRTWVGLTNKEIYECEPKADWYDSVEFGKAIEAKLRSKNEHRG